MLIKPFYLAGKPGNSDQSLEVRDKFSGEILAKVALAGPAQLEQAIQAAERAEAAMAALSHHQRWQILDQLRRRLAEKAPALVRLLVREAGKLPQEAAAEVGRAQETFRFAAESLSQPDGESLPLDASQNGQGFVGYWQRVPVGACAFITPFNFPLNLVAHKVAPAIAAGCPFVLKPASATPLSALLLAELLAETELPPGAFSVLPCQRASADKLVEDPRLKLLSFTGSDLGWDLKARAGHKRVLLELGGNAAVILEPDADRQRALERLVKGAFTQAGQSCISVQRILIHDSLYVEMRERLVAASRELKWGYSDPDANQVGPLISQAEAERVEAWVQAALDAGARLLCGGKQQGHAYAPTLLEDVPQDQALVQCEAFGPVAILSRYTSFEQALAQVNASRYGLQAGVFTQDLRKAQQAFRQLKVGAVLINEIPSWRVDHMPYGGVKGSGLGREGVRFAIEEMSEKRLLVMRL